MRDAIRRWPSRSAAGAVTALASALLLAGCSAGDGGEPGARQTAAAAAADQVLLQPADSPGPAPFTPSTVLEGPPAHPGAPPAAGVGEPAPAGRALTGATPGLYGGTRSVASCDVEKQIALLTADGGRARAFAEAAGIPENNIAGWLRGLTPVLLRADTRVTSHGFRDGGPTAFQSVLQAGTAVLVDPYGTPRVRCGCGNPLRSPADAQGAAHSGKPWPGYRPDRVLAITPTSTVVTRLVIANNADNTWIERRTGSRGDQDRRPNVLPPCAPASCDLVAAPPAPLPDGAAEPPTAPTAPGDPTGPTDPTAPVQPDVPAPDDGMTHPVPEAPDDGGTAPAPDEPVMPDVPDAPVPPDGPQEYPPHEPPPSFEELFPDETAPQQPETFEG
ncbi:DUF6777 domain-containing protein [Streptomyces sp. NPDC126499]|uniref:DUF6777 domain-containing protein n=1 Tax=Streptomyces sp. NPDC126499 TaxID=3155314 RepID=UPI00331DDD0A